MPDESQRDPTKPEKTGVGATIRITRHLRKARLSKIS